MHEVVRCIVRRGPEPVLSGTPLSLRIDGEVPDWFAAQGPGCQVRMNAVLRAFRDASLAA